MAKKIKKFFNEIRNSWKDLEWWKGRYRYYIFSRISKNKGIYIADEEWDNLIILDACRYDIFEELNRINGKLEKRVSRGSNTKGFLLENFKNNPHSFKDIVYVSANPYVTMFLSAEFHRIIPVWDYGWDSNLNTVPPENVVEATLEAHRNYPNNRLIIHFMQPHAPFLTAKFPNVTGFKEHRNAALKNVHKMRDLTVWSLLKKGELDPKDVWSAYRKNLVLVLPYVKTLLDILPGKTIVTSDHGNLISERPHILYPFKESGHPDGFYVKKLTLVPWFISINKKSKISEKIRLISKIKKFKDQTKY